MRTLKRLVFPALAVSTLALVFFASTQPSGASADVGTTSGRGTWVTCYDNKLVASVQLKSSQQHDYGQQIFVGGLPSQAGAFQIKVFYSPSGADGTWSYAGYTSDWYKQEPLADVWNNFPIQGFYDVLNLRTGRWEINARTVNLNARGYYKVATNYYWYPTQWVGSGSAYDWATEYYNATPGNGVFGMATTFACRV